MTLHLGWAIEQAIAKVLTPENIKASIDCGLYDVGHGDTVTGQEVNWTWVAANLADELRQAFDEAVGGARSAVNEETPWR